MNIYGHQEIIKELGRQERFWEKTSERAFAANYKTAARVCEHHAEGERAKIKYHKSKIRELKQQRGDKVGIQHKR